MIILKKPRPAYPPNTSSEILPLPMIINAKLDIADCFNQPNPLLYHCNNLLRHRLQPSPHKTQ
jgi:hypothetical protein